MAGSRVTEVSFVTFYREECEDLAHYSSSLISRPTNMCGRDRAFRLHILVVLIRALKTFSSLTQCCDIYIILLEGAL